MQETGYNAWRIAALSPWPTWALASLTVGVLTALAWTAWRLKAEPSPGRRGVLFALRIISAALVLFLLYEPAVRLLQTARVKNRLAILVDTSRSMNFPTTPGGTSRAVAAGEFVKQHRAALESLNDRASLEWFTFSREATPTDPVTLTRGAPGTGDRTDLMGALKAVAAGGGRKLAGALVISDGTDNGALADGLTPAHRTELRALGIPITTIATGQGAPKDLNIERVAVDDFAFVRNTLTVEATLTARGFDREEIPVVLRREGTVVASATLKLRPGQERYTLPLTFAPDVTGTFVYTLATPIFPGEAVTENNARSFVLRVIRDRMRVLLVAGRPSWDERFLRGLLKQDPNVDLISFFILRTVTDTPGAQEDLSLIPFPVAEIFGEQLRTFDAVIFLDFAYQPYRSLEIERFLPGLRDYVKGGGAFAMIGGEQSFGEGRYGETPIGEILPVSAISGLGIATETIRPRLTPEGRRHPVTSLADGEGPNAAAWDALPPLPDLNRTRPLGTAEGATVLLESPTVLVEGKPAPIVAVREVGAGRSLAVTTDASWTWGFLAAESGGTSHSYQRFWNNALRWLVRDPALTPVQVQPDRPVAEPGEPLGFTITARAPDYGPAAGATVHAELTSADGRPVGRVDAVANADGMAHLAFPPPPPGAYRIAATATPRCATPPCSTQAERAFGAIAVRSSGPEDADAAPRPELLRAIAEATGGSFSSSERLPNVPLTDPEVVEVGRRKDQPIWDRGALLAALVLTLACEWILRRRWGYW